MVLRHGDQGLGLGLETCDQGHGLGLESFSKVLISSLSITEHNGDAEPDMFESESSFDSDEEPLLSNVVMHTVIAILLEKV